LLKISYFFLDNSRWFPKLFLSMISRKFLCLIVSLVLAVSYKTQAQGTAFTYQGRLHFGNSPATGNYDLAFSLFSNSNSMGQAIASFTNFNTFVATDGLFTATLDFGPGIFNGTNLWLLIGVRSNGGGGFSFLSPLQAVTASPYAITAGTVTGPLTGSGAGLTNLNWGAVTKKPSTLAGYGITDGVTATMQRTSLQAMRNRAPRIWIC
jgi:hypothetical protein